jgi:hypothetical protein
VEPNLLAQLSFDLMYHWCFEQNTEVVEIRRPCSNIIFFQVSYVASSGKRVKFKSLFDFGRTPSDGSKRSSLNMT